MNKIILMSVATSLLFALPVFAVDGQDSRQKIKVPDMMKQHMLGNMRDHLAALHEIQVALAKGELDKAGDIAEQRIGMTSLISHNAAHMAAYMPKAMQDIGTAMHHAASRFAITAKEGDTLKALDSLSAITQQCVACHAAYRLN
jgi:hypothetical protein